MRQVEDIFRANSNVVIPAGTWPTAKDDLEMDLIQMMKDQSANVSACLLVCLAPCHVYTRVSLLRGSQCAVVHFLGRKM